MVKKKILVMGLPGSWKTTLAENLITFYNAVWINADKIRKEADDWDFSSEGRVRQADRMKTLAQKAIDNGRNVVADFICPTEQTRADFKADYIIWMDTIKEGRFDDTNKMFVQPTNYDFKVTHKDADMFAFLIKQDIQERFND